MHIGLATIMTVIAAILALLLVLMMMVIVENARNAKELVERKVIEHLRIRVVRNPRLLDQRTRKIAQIIPGEYWLEIVENPDGRRNFFFKGTWIGGHLGMLPDELDVDKFGEEKTDLRLLKGSIDDVRAIPKHQ